MIRRNIESGASDAVKRSTALLHRFSTWFQKLHDQHWRIEQYHLIIKQVCNIEKFQVRGNLLIRNHIARDLYNDVVTAFVAHFIVGKEYLNPQFRSAVNT